MRCKMEGKWKVENKMREFYTLSVLRGISVFLELLYLRNKTFCYSLFSSFIRHVIQMNSFKRKIVFAVLVAK